MLLFKFSNAAYVQQCGVVFLYIILSKVLSSNGDEILDVEPAVERMRLRTDLLSSYDRLKRPVVDRTDPTTVSILFDAQHIIGLEERDQVLSVTGVLSLLWTDQFLRWNPNSYSGISFTRFSPDEIWMPDVHAEYNVRALKIYDKEHSPPVLAYSNGSVEWYPRVRFDVPCSADYRHYPFDTHNCSFVLLTYGYGIALATHWSGWNHSQAVQGTEWVLKDISHELEVVEDKHVFHQVIVRILLERVSRMYRYICVVPTLISIATLLFGFWLLPNEASRYVIGCANIIVLSMLLQHLAITVPSGSVVPLIAQYSASCLCFSAIFVVVTVIANLLRESNGTAPNALVRLAHVTLDRHLCIFTFSHVSGREGATPGQADEVKRRKDWYSVSMLVDRLAFCIFAFVFLMLLAVLAAV